MKLRTQHITSSLNNKKMLHTYTTQTTVNLSLANTGKFCDITLTPNETLSLIEILKAHIVELDFGEWCEVCTLPGDICKCKKSEDTHA